MWRLINFLTGFIVGVAIGASLGLLMTPQSGQDLKVLFKKEFEAKKAELEGQFFQPAR